MKLTQEERAARRAMRFWRRVQKGEGCWIWIGGRTGNGYGAVRFAGRDQPTHRVSWEMAYGPVPPGLWVLHHCDNKPCVRPDHLFLGTPADNTRDMHSKGRAAPPEAHRANVRVTRSQAVDIIWRLAVGERARCIARELGVHWRVVHRIAIGETWTDLTGTDPGTENSRSRK